MLQDKYEERLLLYISTCKTFNKVGGGSILPLISAHMDGSYWSSRCKKTVKKLAGQGKIIFNRKERLWLPPQA
jgi:hypothetical protein